MADKLWKSVERRIARYFGAERIPRTGKPCEDFRTDNLIVEVKHREKLPKWIKEALEDAELYLKQRENVVRVCLVTPRTYEAYWCIPILVLHEKHMKIEECLVVLRLKDFKGLL